ncbi:hypothetical protein EVAR_3560_1 [Eumeta japonica]|uniref:Uncharacterized protein n=1 Tax=Eumeta variegata TaxID=151549 RepID=A0A4C1SVH8_EUMVA|nr:hypothetical protein EVAR_3560_1 [Eumeta japonica]
MASGERAREAPSVRVRAEGTLSRLFGLDVDEAITTVVNELRHVLVQRGVFKIPRGLYVNRGLEKHDHIH